MNKNKITIGKSKIEIITEGPDPFKLVKDLDFDLNIAKVIIVIIDEVERQLREEK